MRHKWDPKCTFPSGVVRPVRIDPAGKVGPTTGQARGPLWRRTSYGFYVPATASPDVVEQRVLEAAVRLPAGGAVTGWAACRLWGANFFDGLEPDGRTPIPVPLALAEHGRIRADGRVTLSNERLADEVADLHGIRSTRRERATFDEMRRTPDLRESVVALDMMAAAEQTTIIRMRAYAAVHSRWKRVGQVRKALDLASEHSWSPNETRLRLIVVLDAGITALHVNCPIHDRDGRLLGIADLLDEAAGLVVEYDGADHRGARRHHKDVGKEDRLRRSGLEVARVTGLDLADRPSVVERVQAARGRARFAVETQRTWVARPLPDTLEDKLQHREYLEELMRSG